MVYDIRYGSLPVQLLSTCFVQCQFDTHLYTYDLGHAFVPVYMESYKKAIPNLSFETPPRMVTCATNPKASDLLIIMKQSSKKAFLATPVHANSKDLGKDSLTGQATLVYDMLRLASRESLQIQGCMILPTLYPNSQSWDIPFWDYRNVIQKGLEFATDFQVIGNVHMLVHKFQMDKLGFDLVSNKRKLSYNMICISLNSTSKYTWNIENANVPTRLESPDEEASLEDSLSYLGSSAGTNLVSTIRMDIHNQLSELDSLEKIFKWVNSTVMPPGDAEINSRHCFFERCAIQSRTSPTPHIYKRWDIEVPTPKLVEYALSLQATYPLTKPERQVLVFPLVKDLKNCFAFAIKDRSEENTSIIELIDKCWSSPLMSDCIAFMIPRTPWSLAVMIDPEAVPQTNENWDRHLFTLLDKRGYRFVKAQGLKIPTYRNQVTSDNDQQLTSIPRPKCPSTIHPKKVFISAPQSTTFINIKSSAALFGELVMIKPTESETQGFWQCVDAIYKNEDSAFLANREVITGVAFQCTRPNDIRKAALLAPFLSQGKSKWEATLEAAKALGSQKEMQRTRNSLALPLEAPEAATAPGIFATAASYVPSMSRFRPY